MSLVYQIVIVIGNKAFRKKKEIILIENRERWYKKQGREALRNILRGAGISKVLVGACLCGGHNLIPFMGTLAQWESTQD